MHTPASLLSSNSQCTPRSLLGSPAPLTRLSLLQLPLAVCTCWGGRVLALCYPGGSEDSLLGSDFLTVVSWGGVGAAPPRGAPWERWAGPRGAFVPMASLEAAAVSSFCLPGPCGSRSQPPRLPAPPFVPSSRSPGPSRASAPLLLCSVQTLPCPWVPSLVLRLRQWTGAGLFNGPAPTSVQRDTDGRETGRGPGVTQ